jgi:antirestriction protein ArdC
MPAKAPAKRRAQHPDSGKTVTEIVTRQIIEALEAGVAPWHQPWTNLAGGFPTRMSTGTPYQGINVFILATIAWRNGYRSAWWGTRAQIEKAGGSIRDEENRNAALVVLYKDRRSEKEDDQDDDKDPQERRRPPIMRFYRVWNAEQCDGLPAKYHAAALAEGTFAEHQPAELVVKAYLAREPHLTVRHGGNRAYWDPRTDRMGLPEPGQFDSPALYYSTKFHEMIHSTGDKDRLNRATDEYATSLHVRGDEELTAEMGAAILATITGLQGWFNDSASYIAGWLEDIKGDPGMVIRAAAKAHAAVEYVLGTRHQDEADAG